MIVQLLYGKTTFECTRRDNKYVAYVRFEILWTVCFLPSKVTIPLITALADKYNVVASLSTTCE